MVVKYILDPGGANEKTITEDNIVSHNPAKTHTGIADLRATFIEDRSLDSYAQRQDRLNVEIDGTIEWTGYMVGVQHTTRSGQSTIRAEGIAKRLKETRPDYSSLGGSLTYSSQSLEDAIDDYWSRTPFSSATVTTQSTETVATDTEIQSADTDSEFTNITSLSDTDPFLIQNSEVQLAQTAFFSEGEDWDSANTGLGNITDSEASESATAQFSDSVDNARYDFNTDVKIPESNVSVAYRVRQPDGTNDDSITLSVDIDGDQITPLAIGPGDTGYTWTGQEGWSNGDLSSGSHDLKLDVTKVESGETDIYIDCVVLYDSRYTSYTSWDNTLDGNNALEDPPQYPDAQDVTVSQSTTSYNITEATVNLTIDDTTDDQAIGISFDGGSTYNTTNNNSSGTETSSNATRTVDVKLTLSNYGTQTDTPTENINGQKVDDYELLVDTDTLVVIDDLELSRNHFENLQQLHQYGDDWNWTIEHSSKSPANMTVTSYQEGDETRPKPSGLADPIEERAEVQADAYYNAIYLQGAKNSSGNRPTAEVKDQTAINNDGREISPGVLRTEKISTEAGAEFRASQLLQASLNKNNLTGTKTVAADTLLHPGYQYSVDFGNGDQNKTLEEISISETGSQTIQQARFSAPEADLSQQIGALQRNTRDISDNV